VFAVSIVDLLFAAQDRNTLVVEAPRYRESHRTVELRGGNLD
jgi:hypothetical protein